MERSTSEEKQSINNDKSHSHIESGSPADKNVSVVWTARQVIAAVSLSILWVGEFSTLFSASEQPNNMFRLTGSLVFYWSYTVLHGS
jgi:hypothetical protein